MRIKTNGSIWLRRAVTALALLATCGLMAKTEEYNGVVYETDGEIVPGQWNSQFAKAKALADETDTPLVVFWANPGCAYCRRTEEAMALPEFRAWMEERQYLFVFALGADTPDGSAAKSFARSPSRQFPYVGVYWPRGLENSTKNPEKFSGRSGSMPVKQGSLGGQLMASVDRFVGSYEVPFKGGTFEIEESAFHRLEADAATTTIPVTLTRRASVATKEAASSVRVILPDGTTNATITVDWTAASGTVRTIDVAIPEGAFTAPGQQMTLEVVDDEGEVQDTTHITYVEEANSAHNPLWLGEDGVDFGVWTMDLDAAKGLVEKAEGAAYTLALVQGALWCPDCEGVTANFLAATNAAGENAFAAWARAHQVALVSIDVPRFDTNTVESTRPTLLSRELRAGSLDPKERSGLGYLSRKGVKDETAAEVLERNRQLVTLNTAEGGFHRPENASPYRTGVPMFVMLRKDGSVAARLTRFADMGRETAAEKWDYYIKRFDEMLALAMAGEHADDIENNDAASTKDELAANGGAAAGELSHVDATDVFKLTGVTGAAVQRVRISGATTADVKFYTLNDAGQAVAVDTTKPVEGEFETTFTTVGEHFVKVSVNDKAGAFDVASGVAGNFVAYSLTSEVPVFVPVEARATGAAAAGSTDVAVRLEAGVNYMFEGVSTEANADVLTFEKAEGAGAIYTAKATGDQILKLTDAGGSFVYRRWLPGTVAFGETANRSEVRENAGSWTIPVVRTDGASGAVTVKIAVNAEETDYLTNEGEPRYAFAEQTLTWADGETAATNVVVKLLDDTQFDGDGKVVLEMTLVDGVAALGAAKYVLTVRENEKADAGSIGFTSAEPFFGKPGTVYVKASEGATMTATRTARNDGAVSATIKPSVATAAVAVNGVVTNAIAWGDHDSEPVEVKVSGLQAGKTVRVTLSQPRNGVKLLSGATAVSVVAVADDAPEFAKESQTLSLVRYVAVNEEIALKEGTYEPTNKIAVAKLTGALPSGVTVKWDAARGRLVVAGVPTAKAGSYRATFQVTETRARRAVPGLTTELLITVVDPVVAAGGAAALNPAVATARTFKAVPMIVGRRELVGTLDVTIPATGRVSAKYLSAAGTVSFSARNWTEEAKGTLTTEAASKGYALRVSAEPAGAVRVELTDPSFPGETLVAEIAGDAWSRTNPATPWVGYYTMALKPKAFVEKVTGVAPRGSGFLTLTMSASDARTGTVRYSGMLPNGTAVSGSSTLTAVGEDRAVLAIFKKASKNIFTALFEMRTEAVAEAVGEPTARIVPFADLCEMAACLYHTENVAEGTYAVAYDTFGNLYSGTDLAGCCEEGYETDVLNLSFDVTGLGGWAVGGVPRAFDALKVNVTANSMALAGKTVNPQNPQSVTFSFSAKTGVVKGTFYLPYTTDSGERRVAAKYQGVVVTGWGEGCGCSEVGAVPEFLPFVNGAYFFADKVSYEVETRTGTVIRQLSVQRGGDVKVDK